MLATIRVGRIQPDAPNAMARRGFRGRVFVGVHYPLDVFGGGLLALVVTLCIRYLQLKNKNGHTLHSRE